MQVVFWGKGGGAEEGSGGAGTMVAMGFSPLGNQGSPDQSMRLYWSWVSISSIWARSSLNC